MSNIVNELKRISEVGFRDISGHLLYIESKDILEKMMEDNKSIRSTSTGLIVYAYIDHTRGLSCQPAVIAEVEGDKLQVFNLENNDTKFIFRISEEEINHTEEIGGRKMRLCNISPDHRFCDTQLFGRLSEEFKPFREFIDKQYGMNNSDHNSFRNKTEWDSIRNPYWPDDFQVYLSAEDRGIEVVWVRAEYDTEVECLGELLNEPYQDFGIHQGDMIGFKELEKDDGEIILYSTLNVWKREGLN